MIEHTYVYVEPSIGAFVTGVCSCGELLTGYGATSLATMLSIHIKAVKLEAFKRRMERVATLQEGRKQKGYSK